MVVRELPTEVRNALRTGVIITNASQGVIELVLNSLDAGATSIAIRVDLIAHKLQVVDNGCGMDNHTLDLVGLRYMTSKCQSLEDLRKPLKKFGFRGEALASLRNVSRVLMIESRGANSGTFCKVFKEGKAFNAVSSNTQRPSRGTTVTVQDFMYNMPVRRQRIRDALNLEDIKGLIEATALTHPQVSFSLRNDVNGSIILQTLRTTDTLKTFSYLFGQEITQSLIHVKHSSGNFKLYGYISTEAHFQNNLQFIYVNKRLVNKTQIHKFVTSLLVKSSIFRANGRCKTRNLKSKSNGNWLDYSPSPKREMFPVYLLNVKCAYTEYDVSFDQKKTLLEFLNWDSVLKCLEEVITTFLDEKHLGIVVDTKTNNARDKRADASVLNETEELAQEQASGLVECVLSDNSTKHSRNNVETKIIRGYQDQQGMVDHDHDPSHKQNQILRIRSTRNSTIKCVSKPELEPKTQHTTSQLIPINSCVEDPLTPSPAINPKRVLVSTISISKHESTLLSEDPMVYSDNEREPISQKCNEKRRHRSNNEKGIVRADPHLRIEARQDLCFKSMFSLPLFPKNRNNDEYIGLRDIMRKALLQTLEKLSQAQQKHGLRDKTLKVKVLKITERKLTVNRSSTIQSKISNNNIAKSSNGNELAKTSSKLDVVKSPYFEFLPVVVTNKKQEEKVLNAPLQCVRSPYFAKPLPQNDKNSMGQISNISNPPIVRSPYFKSSSSHSKTSNSTVHTHQLRNCHQTLQIEKSLNFASLPAQSKPCNIARCICRLKNSSLACVVDRRQAVDLPAGTEQYTITHRNCICLPNEHIDNHFTNSHVGGHVNNCQLPSRGNAIARPTFTHFLGQPSDNSRYCPPQPITLLEPKRNYLTTADLICTLETVRRSYNRTREMLSIEEYIPSLTYSRPPSMITWGNIQYHSMEENNNSQDCSYKPNNASCSSSSSVSYGDPASGKCESSQRIVQTSHHVAVDDDQSRYLGSVYRQVEECKHPSSSHDSDNELTTETNWSFNHKDIIRMRNNRLIFQSVRDSIQGVKGQASSQNNYSKWPSTHESPASSEHELEDGGYAPQFDRSAVSNVQRMHSPTKHCNSPPPIKFNKLFSLSTSEDERYEPSRVRVEQAEENLSTLMSRKRGRENIMDYVITSKKPRWENSVVEDDSVADSVQGYETSKTPNGICEPDKSADPDAVRTGSSVANITSERSSGEDFLAHVLHERPLKCNPNRQFLDDSAQLAECEKVPQITPDDVKEGCELIDAMQVSEDAGHEEVSITNSSLEAVLCVDKDELNHQRQTTEEVSGCTVEADQPALSENTRLQPEVVEEEEEEAVSNQSEWVQRRDADGNTFFVHSRTGMTSFEGPVSRNGGDPYSMTTRYDFLPKGMSPILKDKVGGKSVWNTGVVGNEELFLVKWRDDQPKCEDLIKQMMEDVEKRMAFCEPVIPNTNIQDRTAVGVYNLLTSFTFTKDVFTSLEVLGQLDNKFIVTLVSIESARSAHLLVLFDQHAVDERIRLEHLVEDYLAIGVVTQFKTSPIESPIVVNMTAQELRIVSNFEKEFERIGLKFSDPTETSLKVTSVPSCLKARESRVSPEHHATLLKTSVETLLKGHATAIVSGGGVGPRIPNILQTVINSEACRGAIKFGDALSIEACTSMLTSLSECVLPFQCAHGRPSLIPIVDMTQIRIQQQQHTQVETKPNYLNLKKYL